MKDLRGANRLRTQLSVLVKQARGRPVGIWHYSNPSQWSVQIQHYEDNCFEGEPRQDGLGRTLIQALNQCLSCSIGKPS